MPKINLRDEDENQRNDRLTFQELDYQATRRAKGRKKLQRPKWARNAGLTRHRPRERDAD